MLIVCSMFCGFRVCIVEAAGGRSVPIECDVRRGEMIERAVQLTVDRFGGIDVLVNNASAISLTDTLHTPASKFDLMHQVNVRATFLWYAAVSDIIIIIK